MEIVTERLLLRRPRSSDLNAMFAIMSDPRAMRYWSTLPHADRDVTRPWLERMVARTAEGGEDFLIELDGRVIGNVGAGRLPDFGFILHPDFWGRGLAHEAAFAFIVYVFAAHDDLDRLAADVDPRNHTSLRLLDKLGFTITGHARNTFRLGDEWCDSTYLELPRPGA